MQTDEREKIANKLAKVEGIVHTSMLDTKSMKVLSNNGGESMVYDAPNHYFVPGHPEISSSKVVIKVMRTIPEGDADPAATSALLALNWLSYSPGLRLTDKFTSHPDLAKAPANIRQIIALTSLLEILHPAQRHQMKNFISNQVKESGGQLNLIETINQKCAKSSIIYDGKKIEIKKAFPTIYDFGLTTNLEWFMVMQKADKLLLDTLAPHRVKFTTYPEAEKGLRILELSAQLAIIHQLGFIVGDVKPQDLALIKGDLVQLDPTLTHIGQPLHVFTDDYLPPEDRLKLPQLPIARPEIDRYAVAQILHLAVSSGIIH